MVGEPCHPDGRVDLVSVADKPRCLHWVKLRQFPSCTMHLRGRSRPKPDF
jgi:hypothetical protein